MSEHALRMALLAALGALGLYFAAVFVAGLREVGRAGRVRPTLQELVTGFVTVFFDTLGIGSFATTTAIFRAWRLVPDELIPGTLNVGPRYRVGALRVRLHRSRACRREHADSDGGRLGRRRMARVGRGRRAGRGIASGSAWGPRSSSRPR